jgi:hypothetical protein
MRDRRSLCAGRIFRARSNPQTSQRSCQVLSLRLCLYSECIVGNKPRRTQFLRTYHSAESVVANTVTDSRFPSAKRALGWSFRRREESEVMRWFMARLIKFYTRRAFNPKSRKVPADQMGKLIEFSGTKIKKSA